MNQQEPPYLNAEGHPFDRLPPWARKALDAAGIHTAELFAKVNAAQLHRFPGIGSRRLTQIIDASAREYYFLWHGVVESDIPPESFDEPIRDSVALPAGVVNHLEGAGIRTFGQLASQTTEALAGIHWIGPSKLQWLLFILAYDKKLTTRLKK